MTEQADRKTSGKRSEIPSGQVSPQEAGSLPESDATKARGKQSSLYWACLVLIGLTIAVYWQTARFDFVNYDDTDYVTKNAKVQAGLTRESLAWAFTATHASNWHPLTWLSHMLDCQLYGLKPAGHHLSSVFLHLANSVLLLLVLTRMTGELWRSALVAALFAIHPLHVESVAWIAERKDVLSTFFGLIALLSYALYAESAGFRRYLAVVFAYALSLMAKPMWVTLPLVLLLLDYWPLRRLGWALSTNTRIAANNWHVLWEKVPLFGLSAASCIVTYLVQQKAMVSAEQLPLSVRLQNALIAYAGYLWRTIWPSGLAFFYPYPRFGFPAWQLLLALIFMVLVTFLAWRSVRHHPYFAVGWLWYVGILVPVIGLVQVGEQAMADRYTYLPLIGTFIMMVWGIPSLLAYRPSSSLSPRIDTWIRNGLAVAAGMAVLSLASCTWIQAGYWRSSVSLCERALRVTSANYLAHTNLGSALQEQGKVDEAIVHFRESLSIAPTSYQAQFNLGYILSNQGKITEAIIHLTDGLRISPNHNKEESKLGDLLRSQGRASEAIEHYSKAIRINPDNVEAHNGLGVVLATIGRVDEAIVHYLEVLRINPNDAFAHNNLAMALERKKQTDQAIHHYTEALRLRPNFAGVHNNLGYALVKIGRIDEAIVHYREALRLDPNYGVAHANLASALLARGIPAEAWKEVKLCRKLGVALSPVFLQALSGKMPEPND